MTPEIFISYSSRDVARVSRIASRLEQAGIGVWRDADRILGGENYGPKIVDAIRGSKVLLLACSEASMRFKNVKQEIQLAWTYDVPYLPLRLEPVQYSEQVEYWLAGSQWIDVHSVDESEWLPRVGAAIHALGGAAAGAPALPVPVPAPADHEMDRLWRLARYTDRLWPVPATGAPTASARLRDLGAPQDDVQHGFPIGSGVELRLESDADGHLLLLDRGATGNIYCLCPSLFAPDTRICRGTTALPAPGSPYRHFVATGQPGREDLLAIVTRDPLPLDWGSHDRRAPARRLSADDLRDLARLLQGLPPDAWTAIATYFDVVAR